MFGIFKKRQFVSYIAKYESLTIRGCMYLYSRTQRDCLEQLKLYEHRVSGKVPESIVITARSLC